MLRKQSCKIGTKMNGENRRIRRKKVGSKKGNKKKENLEKIRLVQVKPIIQRLLEQQ